MTAQEVSWPDGSHTSNEASAKAAKHQAEPLTTDSDENDTAVSDAHSLRDASKQAQRTVQQTPWRAHSSPMKDRPRPALAHAASIAQAMIGGDEVISSEQLKEVQGDPCVAQEVSYHLALNVAQKDMAAKMGPNPFAWLWVWAMKKRG